MNLFFTRVKKTPSGAIRIDYLFPGLGWPAAGEPPEWDPKNYQTSKKTVTFKAIPAHFGVHFRGAPRPAQGPIWGLAGPGRRSVFPR